MLREIGAQDSDESGPVEKPLSTKEIERILRTMKEVSIILTQDHGGKIQKYLRKKSQKILQETLDNFTLKSLDKDEVRIAFTFWYQNIFGLPITLNDENVKRFIKVRGLDVAKFEEIADKLDINIAIVDDLIKSEAEDKRTIVKRKKV